MPFFGENPSHLEFFTSLLWGILQFGAYLGALMCVGQIVLERKTALNRLLAVLFGLLCVFQSCSLLFLSGEFRTYPHLSAMYLPALGSVGPVLYGIQRIATEKETDAFGSLGLDKKHLTIPLLFWLLYLCSFLLPEKTVSESIGNFLSAPGIRKEEMILFFPLFLLSGYVFAILSESLDLFRAEVLSQEWTARILLFLVTATLINLSLGAVYLWTREPVFLLSNASMMGASLCLAYLIGHRRPEFFQTLQEVAQATRQKYARSLLLDLNREALKESLKNLMEKEKLYRDEELSLADLADELALSTHQISELLNQELGRNFAAFVNDYRIREACELLKSQPERSVLDIAFEVGFRTKSSFHRAFQKHTNKTPSEFRNDKGTNL